MSPYRVPLEWMLHNLANGNLVAAEMWAQIHKDRWG